MNSLTRRGMLAGAVTLLAVRRTGARNAPLTLRAETADIPVGAGKMKLPALNGQPSGPPMELRRGEPFVVKIENALGFDLHFRPQGLRGKAVRGNETSVPPGGARDITITPPDTGTFAYCLASEDGLHATETLLLSGPLVVTAEEPHVADREVTLSVNALVLNTPDASLLRVVLVNGAAAVKLTARPDERIRFRMVNPAQEALAALHMPQGTQIVALDGQPCEPFPPLDDLLVLPPLGRADVIVTMPRDATAPLIISDPFDPALKLVTVAPEGEAMPDRYLAKVLPGNPRLPKEIPLTNATRIAWKPGATADDPLAPVKAGASIVLTFENDATTRALMLEGQTARLLDKLDDGWKPWWQDVFLVQPDETMRIAFVPSEPGRYALDMVPLEGNGAPTRAWIEVN